MKRRAMKAAAEEAPMKAMKANESNEGNEEGDEEARNESNEGNEGHEEGNEGDESNEGDEGHEEVIAQYGQRRRSAEMISHGGVPRRALFTVPVLENIQSSALCGTKKK